MEPPKPKSTVLQKLSRLKVKPNVKVPIRTASHLVENSEKTTDLTISSSDKFEYNESEQKKSSELPSIEPQEQSCKETLKVDKICSNQQEQNSSSACLSSLLTTDDHKIEKHQKVNIPPVEELKEHNHGLTLPGYKPRSANKIRPNIDGASHRIRTYSSASESEDEGKRLQSHTRHPSTQKPNLNVPTKTVHQPEAEAVVRKPETKPKKKCDEKSQLEIRKEDMRRKFAKGQVDLSKMTMFDLIYYNPDGEKPTRTKEKITTRRRMLETDTPKQSKDMETNYLLEERIAEEEEERRMMLEDNVDNMSGKEEEGKENVEEVEDEDSAMPVPQVRLGPNGEIILDEQSLVIETSETKKRKTELANAPVIIENSAGLVNYGSWQKRKRSSKWSIRETARFYRALSMLGTDFSLMESLFPRRTRFELKRKFKVEEKINRALIDKTIGTQKPFDASVFGDESGDESEAESHVSRSQAKKNKKANDDAGSAEQSDLDARPRKRKRKKKVTIVESEDEVHDMEGTGPSVPDIQAGEAVVPNLETVNEDQEENDSTLTSLLQSPLGQMSMDTGGVTIVEATDDRGAPSRSLVVPQAVAEENPAFSQAQPGSLVLITSANPKDPANQLIHVYRIASPPTETLSD